MNETVWNRNYKENGGPEYMKVEQKCILVTTDNLSEAVKEFDIFGDGIAKIDFIGNGCVRGYM
jgi:hypothetical protein